MTAVTPEPIDTGTEKMLAHVEDGIGWMTYNNPARLNAMSYDMQIAVPRILGAFAADPDVHVIVVQGAGDRAFVSGADISEFSEKRTTVAARADYDDALAAAWGSWRTVDKPIIAMIRGYCIGGGLLTAMKADIRIAAEGSEFGVPAAKLGLGYAYGGVEELMAPRRTGVGGRDPVLRPAAERRRGPPHRSGQPRGSRRRAGVVRARARRHHRRQRAAHRAGVQGRHP